MTLDESSSIYSKGGKVVAINKRPNIKEFVFFFSPFFERHMTVYI